MLCKVSSTCIRYHLRIIFFGLTGDIFCELVSQAFPLLYFRLSLFFTVTLLFPRLDEEHNEGDVKLVCVLLHRHHSVPDKRNTFKTDWF